MENHRLSESEKDLMRALLSEQETAAVLQKFCAIQELRYTRMCRDQANVIPETLHANMKKRTLTAHYAAIAKAYGAFLQEMKRAAEGAQE